VARAGLTGTTPALGLAFAAIGGQVAAIGSGLWPHYFVDLSGIGGSAPPNQDAVLLPVCTQLGQPLPGGAGQRCMRPELVLLNR
jgi:hypothetical protein